MSDIRGTCLVVDDDEVGRIVATNLVKKLGFDVIEAYDGRHALELCKRNLPDVILLDLYMPEMDGTNFLVKIRDYESKIRLKNAVNGCSDVRKRVVIIICSADRKPTKVGHTMVMGADNYIVKPYNLNEVKEKFYDAGLI